MKWKQSCWSLFAALAPLLTGCYSYTTVVKTGASVHDLQQLKVGAPYRVVYANNEKEVIRITRTDETGIHAPLKYKRADGSIAEDRVDLNHDGYLGPQDFARIESRKFNIAKTCIAIVVPVIGLGIVYSTIMNDHGGQTLFVPLKTE